MTAPSWADDVFYAVLLAALLFLGLVVAFESNDTDQPPVTVEATR